MVRSSSWEHFETIENAESRTLAVTTISMNSWPSFATSDDVKVSLNFRSQHVWTKMVRSPGKAAMVQLLKLEL